MKKSITEFNKSNLKDVRQEINKKLAELKALGLYIKLGNISYTDTSFTSKIECTLAGGLSIEEIEFKRHFESTQFPDAVGKTITLQGKEFTFAGFIPRKRKNKALIIDENGARYAYDFDAISNQL